MGRNIALLEVFTNFRKTLFALMFIGIAGCRNGINRLITFVCYLLAQVFIVNFVVVFALNVSAEFFHQLLLQTTHRLDGFVSRLERFEQS